MHSYRLFPHRSYFEEESYCEIAPEKQIQPSHIPDLRGYSAVPISFDGKKIFMAKSVGTGGAKQIVDIGDGRVIAFISGDFERVDALISKEVDLSERLNTLGLRTQNYGKILIQFNNKTYPVLTMHSFAALRESGIQVFDKKNHEKLNTSYIFGTLENLHSPDHWQKIYKNLVCEIATYLLNNFSFGFDSFNLVIEENKEYKSDSATKIFTEKGQELHLYFYDFCESTSIYEEFVYKEFIDNAGNLIIPNINARINQTINLVTQAVLKSITDEEIQAIYGFKRESIETPKKTTQIVEQQVALEVLDKITKNLNSMSPAERLAKFRDKIPAKNAKSWCLTPNK